MEHKMKKYILLILITLIAGAALIWNVMKHRDVDGSTMERRENALNVSGKNFHISSEIVIDNYIVSGIIGDNEKFGLAIFAPRDGKYKYQTWFLREKGEIAIGYVLTEVSDYNLIWFNQPNMDYALITYMDHALRKELEPIKLDASENQILYSEAPSNNYSIKVVYYDNQGVKYE